MQNKAMILMKKEEEEKKQVLLDPLKPTLNPEIWKILYPQIKIDFSKFKEINFRNNLIYFYSEFEFYFYKCLKHCFIKRPELLEEKEVSIPIKSILDNNYSLEEEVQKKLGKEIEQKLRKNFFNFFEYCSKKLGLKHNLSKTDIVELTKFRQVRNLYVHGDGRVDNLFNDKNPNSPYVKGQKYKIDDNLLNDMVLLFINCIQQFDDSLLHSFPALSIKSEYSKVIK